MWKKWLQILLWCLLGCSCLVLLVAAVQAKDRKTCSDVKIDMDGTGENVFVDTSEIAFVLKRNGASPGVEVENIPLGLMEKELEKNAWIKDAQLFFDNNQLLSVKIVERQPVARVFTQSGRSFYIDSGATLLPLSDRHTARVPVFTSFPMANDTIKGADSAVLRDVKRIAQYIQRDSFWAAQVSQVEITPQHTYEVVPVLGNQVINLGTAEGLETKFTKLFAFYKQVWSKAGFEKYKRIDVQYEGMIVAVKRDGSASDSMLQNGTGIIMDSLYAGAEKREHEIAARDSVAHVNHRLHLPSVAAGKKGQKPKTGKWKKPARAVLQRRNN